jgi:NhaP-type Na+/H+ or K+/H+ antiporter
LNAQFPLRSVAGCFALACFAVALLAGLAADREAGDILRTAILALVVGQVVGLLGGWAIARAFGEALETYKNSAGAEGDGVPMAGRGAR